MLRAIDFVQRALPFVLCTNESSIHHKVLKRKYSGLPKQIVLWIHQPTNQPTKPSQPTNQQPTQPTNPTNQPAKPSQAKQPTNHPTPTSFPHEATELSALLAGEAAAEVAKLSKDQVSLGSPVDQQDPTYRFKKGRFSRLVYLHLYTWICCFLGDVLKKFYHGIHHHFSTSDLGRVFFGGSFSRHRRFANPR